MRICMLSTFYPPWSFGGDAVQVQRLSEALVRRGHEVTVVHSREAHALLTRERPEPPETRTGVRVHAIDTGHHVASPLATYLTGRPLLARGALERALAEPFDVLHFHNPSLLGGPAALAMGKAAVRLYTLHEQWLVCPTHVLWKYNRRVCEKRSCVRCTLVHRRPPQPWRATGLLERSLRRLDAIIAPSDSTARLHEGVAGMVRIERLDHFAPEPPATAEPARLTLPQRPYVLYAGRLEPLKGVDDLLVAVAGLDDVDVVLAGAGSLERRLRREALRRGDVHLFEWLPPEQLEALYRDALAVALPTRTYESCPLLLLEALARGVPVIARDFGGQGEIIAASGGGIAYRDVAGLREAIARLAADPALRAELGRRGRAAWRERWTERAHVDGYEALVGRLAGRAGSAA
jgi:glycosyltransferase involved in cell wall biosynthesis